MRNPGQEHHQVGEGATLEGVPRVSQRRLILGAEKAFPSVGDLHRDEGNRMRYQVGGLDDRGELAFQREHGQSEGEGTAVPPVASNPDLSSLA